MMWNRFASTALGSLRLLERVAFTSSRPSIASSVALRHMTYSTELEVDPGQRRSEIQKFAIQGVVNFTIEQHVTIFHPL